MPELKQLIEEYGGIQPPHLAFYIESIRFSTEAAMNSIDYLADFIKMTNETKDQDEMTRERQTLILDHLQNILTHALLYLGISGRPKRVKMIFIKSGLRH